MLPAVGTPRLWIVAGPNGSGKSTLYDQTDIEGFGQSDLIVYGGKNHDVDGTPKLRLSQALDKLKAIAMRHQQVGDDHLRLAACGLSQSLPSIAHHVHRVAGCGEELLQ